MYQWKCIGGVHLGLKMTDFNVMLHVSKTSCCYMTLYGV